MLPVTTQEIIESFKAAKNLNAAIKNFLKKETAADDKLIRFAKDFRTVTSMGMTNQAQMFIEKNMPTHQNNFMFLARYAHADLIGIVADKVFTDFADLFNATYTKAGSDIIVKNEIEFSNIVKKVHSFVAESIQAADRPSSNFMKNSFLTAIFEEDVLNNALFQKVITSS
jgi:hypothetical protein